MSGYVAHKERIGDFKIKIIQDEDPQHPREDFDGHIGKMICWHNRYELGDKDEEMDIEEFEWRAEKEGFIALPLYLYDHSGLTMNTSGFSCPWDSGQVGFIYCSLPAALEHFQIKVENAPKFPDECREEYEELGKTAKAELDASYKRYRKFYLKALGKDNLAKITTWLEGEVETYDQYLRGEVYGYVVKQKVNGEWEEVDSCWGYYGEPEGYVLEEARSVVKHRMEKAA
jgi:hypothetical protein